jgi:hypothetical protein
LKVALTALAVLAFAPQVDAARRVPAEFATVAAAVAVSASGDTVLVAPGLYAERVTLPGGVTLRAEGAPGSAVLDAGHGGPAVLALGALPAPRLEGFRLTAGSGHDIGGATLGGDLAVVGGGLDALDCTFDGAQATYGGATGASNANVTFRRCTWSGASASFGGAHFQAGGNMLIEEASITGTSAGSGGALYVTGGAHGSFLSSVVVGATATGDGGGLRLDDCVLALATTRIDGCSASGRGGGVAIAAGGQVIATGCVLVDCTSGLGGGLFHVSCAPALGTNAGLRAADCALLSLTRCDLLLGKGASPAAGAATDAAAVKVASSLVAGNASGLSCLDPRATLEVTCSDLYKNGAFDVAGACVPATSGILALDPHLCDLAGRDFDLCANSPLLSPPCGGAPWGAGTLACADCGETPAREVSWGRLKAVYR